MWWPRSRRGWSRRSCASTPTKAHGPTAAHPTGAGCSSAGRNGNASAAALRRRLILRRRRSRSRRGSRTGGSRGSTLGRTRRGCAGCCESPRQSLRCSEEPDAGSDDVLLRLPEGPRRLSFVAGHVGDAPRADEAGGVEVTHALLLRWHWRRAKRAISRRDWVTANAHLAACEHHLAKAGPA